MRNLTGILESVRRCTGGEFPQVCCDVSDAYKELRKDSRMRVLTGPSPDELTPVAVFAEPWVGECLVEAKTAAPQPPDADSLRLWHR